jgi:hypothetical protein
MSSLRYSEIVRRRLVRMLTGDVARPQPPITLAGQRTGSVPQPKPSPPPEAPPPVWTGSAAGHRGHSVEPAAADGEGPYAYAELVRMDNRYRAALLRAFRDGLEKRESAVGLGVPSSAGHEPFRILAAHQRAVRYRDLAGVMAPLP